MTLSSEPSVSESVSAQPVARRLHLPLLLSAVLFSLVLAAYWQVYRYDFVNYDDEAGILETPQIRTGMTWENVKWAFTRVHMGNWQPITNLSHMLDCQLFGVRAGPAHVENVLIHAGNTVLLFLCLISAAKLGKVPNTTFQAPEKRQIPNAKSDWDVALIWQSAFVAALFGLHPVHVESVAWISERKDVLSTLFFLLTIWAYVRYVQFGGSRNMGLRDHVQEAVDTKSTKHAGESRARFFFWISVALYAVALMSKPMVVTLPLSLVLFDFWPLRRWETMRMGKLIAEKVPFVVLALGASIVALFSQAHAQAVESVSYWPIQSRILNAVISYVRYMEKMFWPRGLIAFYPRVPAWPWWQVAGAVLLLAGITLFAVRSRSKRPYLVFGWFWYVITLLPVIGLVQVGAQSMADRYTYIPLIGLFVAIGWGFAAFMSRSGAPRSAAAVAGAACVVICLCATQRQVRHWENSVALFQHMLAVQPNNAVAHNNLGTALYARGSIDEAAQQFESALKISPAYDDANINMGLAEFRRGNHQKAVDHFEAVLRKGPNPKALYNIGVITASEGDFAKAAQYYQAALILKPNSGEAHYGLGDVLAARGKLDEAIQHFEAAIQAAPQLIDARIALGRALVKKGDLEKALGEFREALRMDPSSAEAHSGIAGILEQAGNPEEALAHYEAAVKAQPGLAEAQNNLASLLLRQGRTEEALAHSLEAIRLNPNLAEAHYNAGNALVMQKYFGEAQKHYEDALRLRTNYAEAHQNLGVVLEKLSRDKEAVEQYQALVRLRPDYAAAFNRLAQAQARIGDFTNAIASAEQGVRLASAAGQNELAAQLKDNLVRYRAGKP